MQENSFEYAIDCKPEGKLFWRRFLLVLLYIVVSVAFLVFFIAVRIPQVIALLPILLWILVHYTWLYVSVSYEYVIEVGEISFAVIYDNRKRRELLRVPVRELEAVFFEEPATTYDRVCDFRSSKRAVDTYYLSYYEGNAHILVLFEATKRAIKLLSLYNPSVVRMGKTLRY